MLSGRSVGLVRSGLQNLPSRSIQSTPVLCAAPLKKKKKTDIAIIELRVERKRRKFARLVEELEAQEKIKIPLFEYTIDKHILKSLDERTRKNDQQVAEIKAEQERLNVAWSLYKALESRFDNTSLHRVMKTKLRTLDELNRLSPKLYEKALMLDESLFPFKDEQIIKETVANSEYRPIDGQIVDCTKVWKIEI